MSPSGLAPASSFNEPAWNARAKARMLAARVLTIPSLAMSPTLALAMRAASGESRVSSGNGVRIFSPKASAKRPAIVVAAFTAICCPRIARIAISKPSNAPGTRRPGFFVTLFFKSLSFIKCAAIRSGRAARSNKLRSLPNNAGRTGVSVCVNSTTRPRFSGTCVTLIQPVRLPN